MSEIGNKRLLAEHGIESLELRAAMKPLFLLMYRAKIGRIEITRDDTKADVKVYAEPSHHEPDDEDAR